MWSWWGALLITFHKNLLYKPIFIQMMDGFSWLQNVRVWARPHRFLRSLGGHEREQSHAAWSLVSRGAAVTSQVETITPHQLPAAGGGALTFLLQSLPYLIESIRPANTLPLSSTNKESWSLGHLFSTGLGLFSFWPSFSNFSSFDHPPSMYFFPFDAFVRMV